MEDVIIYSEGLVCMSVCSSLSAEETVNRVNEISPPGTNNGKWELSKSENFYQGTPNPCPCERDPSRKHYLLNC
jgi:hypothetical protein